MNSILQVVWAIPEIQQRYVQHTEDIFKSAPADVAGDFLSQVRHWVYRAGMICSGGANLPSHHHLLE